jgi:CDGSH iron-sulfur domain-containing protein 3
MNKPVNAGKSPQMVTLEPGKYFWCACGQSKNQPFCDGSHKGSGFFSLSFEVEERKKVWLCMCKESKNKPYCDGTHREL